MRFRSKKLTFSSVISKENSKFYVVECIALTFFIAIFVSVNILISHIYTDFGETIASVLDQDYSIRNASPMDTKRPENLRFSLPMHSIEVNVRDTIIEMRCDTSIVVKSPEDGIIESIESVSGVMIITIRHAKNVVSRIINVEMCGVHVSESVSKGKDIALSRVGEIVGFEIYVDDVPRNLKLDKNGVKWD